MKEEKIRFDNNIGDDGDIRDSRGGLYWRGKSGRCISAVPEYKVVRTFYDLSTSELENLLNDGWRVESVHNIGKSGRECLEYILKKMVVKDKLF